MVKLNCILFSLLLLINSCSDNKSTVVRELIMVNDDYSKFKKSFNSELINHFPEKITSEKNFVVCNTDKKKNDVSLILTEIDLTKSELKNIENNIKGKYLAIYNVSDSCLLKVNSFETKETKENYLNIKNIDTSKINDICLSEKFPVPNFIDNSINYKSDFWKDENNVIYVFEAKSGNYFKEYDLKANLQMPDKWKNGYSKGIVINKSKKSVIYWSIIW